MRISKELFEIARVAEKEPNDRNAIDCVKFATDGLRNEAEATDGCSAILVRWSALEETEGAEVYLIPASDCLHIKPGIKRIGKESTAQISDGDDGFTLFEQFNEIGSIFRSPTTHNRFPNVKKTIEDRIDSNHLYPSFSFSISRLARLFSVIEKLIGSSEIVELRFNQDETGTVIVIQHRGTKIVDAMLLEVVQ